MERGRNYSLLEGDARKVLRTLPEASVQTVITSPPYWGLRDFSSDDGGSLNVVWSDGDCDHKWSPDIEDWGSLRPPRVNRPRDRPELEKAPAGWSTRDLTAKPGSGNVCPRCNAWRGQLGLEPTPALFVEHIVEVFREVRRVLRDDGTLWLNLGDSYSGTIGSSNFGVGSGAIVRPGYPRQNEENRGIRIRNPLPAKNLLGMPWRVAFGLQEDGWFLRSDVIWSKPNPMPESVSDRPTRAHEYLFLFTKRPSYFYDAHAVREKSEFGRRDWSSVEGNLASYDAKRASATVSGGDPKAGRNKRTVWEIPTQAYPEAHFATFPEKLVEPCIKAGTPEKGSCAECGRPWDRGVEKSYIPGGRGGPASRIGDAVHGPEEARDRDQESIFSVRKTLKERTVGFRPACDHEGDPIPAIVLDPFCGSGTAGLVAIGNGRRFIGIDIKPSYLAMAEKRLRGFPVRLDYFNHA